MAFVSVSDDIGIIFPARIVAVERHTVSCRDDSADEAFEQIEHIGKKFLRECFDLTYVKI